MKLATTLTLSLFAVVATSHATIAQAQSTPPAAPTVSHALVQFTAASAMVVTLTPPGRENDSSRPGWPQCTTPCTLIVAPGQYSLLEGIGGRFWFNMSLHVGTLGAQVAVTPTLLAPRPGAERYVPPVRIGPERVQLRRNLGAGPIMMIGGGVLLAAGNLLLLASLQYGGSREVITTALVIDAVGIVGLLLGNLVRVLAPSGGQYDTSRSPFYERYTFGVGPTANGMMIGAGARF